MSALDNLDFRIRGGRVVRGGVNRAATAEEMELWEALNADNEEEALAAAGARKKDGETLDHYEMTEEVNDAISYAREVTHPTPQEAISRPTKRNKHRSEEDLQKALKARDEQAEENEDTGTDEGNLSGVDFASDEASELAADEGLTAADFDGVEPSGQNGYTKADVQKIVG